jgi:hypothetical protein
MDLNSLLKARRPLVDNAPPSQALLTNPNDHLRQSIMPFFSLPREIRDLIYDFVLNDEHFWFGHIERRFGASYAANSMNRVHHRWPPCIMFISKQFFSEAVDRAQIIQLLIDVLCEDRSYSQEYIDNRITSRYRILPADQTTRQALQHAVSASALRILGITIVFGGHERFGVADDSQPWLHEYDIKLLDEFLDQLPQNLEKVMVEVQSEKLYPDLVGQGLAALCHTLRQTAMKLVRSPTAIPKETVHFAMLNGTNCRIWKFGVTTVGCHHTEG